MNRNAAAEEAFQFISTDELKLELFAYHFQSGGANSDITTRTIEAVRKSKEARFVTRSLPSITNGKRPKLPRFFAIVHSANVHRCRSKEEGSGFIWS